MASETKWNPVESIKPEIGRKVDWIAPSGDVVKGGTRNGKLWFLPGGEMYVYYTPTHWRYSEVPQ